MSEGYTGLPAYYLQSSDPITPNLLLSLKGMDPIVAEDFVKIDTFAAGPFGSTLDVNGVAVPSPNFINSASVVFSVVGSNISATASGSSGTFPITFPAVPHEWINSYSSITGLFTATQPAASDLSNGTTGTGAVVLASAIAGFGSGTVTSVALTSPGVVYTVTGSPITTSGTFALSLVAQTANTVFAGPTSGGAVNPTFRALVAADLPAGTGTVTSFSAGALSPLFTTSVATPTTTPALTFSLSNASPNFVFAGPASGGAGAPSFRALVTADIPAADFAWSALTNATAALTLNNSTFSTTFNQNAGDIWTWGLPSYTAAVSNSPTLELAGSYQSAAATFAKDFWTIINTPTAAVTNGVDKLVFAHSGTTGIPFVVLPNIQFTASSADIDVNNNGGSINITQQNGVGSVGSISWGSGPGAWGLGGGANANASTLFLEGRMAAATPVISFGNALSQTATSGTMIGLDIGGGTAGTNNNVGFTFNPASGTGVFIGTRIAPTIQGTTSGVVTALQINPTVTTTGLTGAINLLDVQTGSVSKFTINNVGHINNTPGDVQGTLTSASGTTVSKTYATAYTSTPTVVVTPTSSVATWYISASSNTGFTITYTLTGAATFNYFVYGNPT